jgi:hypothetical protein
MPTYPEDIAQDMHLADIDAESTGLMFAFATVFLRFNLLEQIAIGVLTGYFEIPEAKQDLFVSSVLRDPGLGKCVAILKEVERHEAKSIGDDPDLVTTLDMIARKRNDLAHRLVELRVDTENPAIIYKVRGDAKGRQEIALDELTAFIDTIDTTINKMMWTAFHFAPASREEPN